jgi:hypothetical protein
MVQALYEWKFDETVRNHLRMEGDRVYSSIFQLGRGHAVRLCAAVTATIAGDDPKYDYRLVMTLEPPVVTAGVDEGAGTDDQQQREVLAGRWRVTVNYNATSSNFRMYIFVAICFVFVSKIHQNR